MGLKQIILALLLLSHELAVAKNAEFYITLEKNTFSPPRLHIPADKKVRIIITNLDNEPEEFDSFDLNREKVLFPGKKSVIYVGPLKPGIYEYFGEFHPNTAKGSIIVKLKESNNAD
ncbi:cupredoxin domain-containing protein [Paraglaciecola marina]|uniref:cupredoxin domain-containing protein n=1 Tax=Paraglaciecola marina TaxID=2500157 RepID=UPI001EF10D6D|nr:cupredoxin domain-containing protein [Paraglaciecola marina]